MSYPDQKYYSDIVVTLPVVGTGVYTSIASAGVATNTNISSKNYLAYRAMSAKGGSVAVVVAPSSTLQPCTVAIMDGTSTVATAVVTTLTAGQNASFTIVTSSVAAGDTLTVNEIGTATASTASGSKTGQYDIELTFNRAFA